MKLINMNRAEIYRVSSFYVGWVRGPLGIMYHMESISCRNFHIVQHKKYNVDNIYVVTSLNWTPIFDWYVVWCGSKNGYGKHVIKKKVVTLTFKSQHNFDIERLYDHLMSTRIITLILNKILM